MDTELLLGKYIHYSLFNDTNVGRVLDKLFIAGPQKIFLRFPKMLSAISNWIHAIITLTPHPSQCLESTITLPHL